jgi:hypothetical protein
VINLQIQDKTDSLRNKMMGHPKRVCSESKCQ